MTSWEIIVLVVVATLGHAMALIWYLAARYKWKLCERAIYDLPISDGQIRRELRNSLHAPIHAVILAAFLWLGFFNSTGWVSFWLTGSAPQSGRKSGTISRIARSTYGSCTGFTRSITAVM